MNTRSIDTMLITIIILTIVYWLFNDDQIKENFMACAKGFLKSNKNCSKCPAGNYCPTPDISKKCPAGSYCPQGSDVPLICPAGSFCPEKSYEPTLCHIGTTSAAGASDITNCTSVTMGRYIKLQQQYTSYQDFAEIEVFSQKGGPNIITPKTIVKASSTPNQALGMSNLVDNNLSTYAHTNTNKREWIEIDLGKMVPIYQINLHNRKDCCNGRATGVVLSILDQNKVPLYTANPIADKSGSSINTLANTNSKNTWNIFVYFPPNPNVNGYNKDDKIPK
jgi:hypothetical protein